MGNERDDRSRTGLERLLTGINGLDEVLRGGFVRGGVYLIGGEPGTGKTTFGNHLAFNHARAGWNALFATVLGETHARMLSHLRGFSFLDSDLVSRRVHYVSIYDELSERGLDGALSLLRRLVREHRATLLVIDGAGMFRDFATSDLAYRQFAHELQIQLAAINCTAVLLSDYDSRGQYFPIGNHVDGIVLLEDEEVGHWDVRVLHVVKLRGVDYLRGRHEFAITDDGIEIYPRIESTAARLTPGVAGGTEMRRLSFGIAGLDEMLRGGLLAGSTTLMLGAPGAGKTLTGLHFIVEGARRGEGGVIAGFHETEGQLIAQAEGVGLELREHLESGLVRMYRQPPLEVLLDAWARHLLQHLDEARPKRLFVDAVTDVRYLSLLPARLAPFLAALTDELRSRDVTSLFSAEVESLFGMDIAMPIQAAFASVENTILLRYVELRSRLRRLVSVLKVRGSDHDTSIREFTISRDGIVVAHTFAGADAEPRQAQRAVPAQLDPGPYRSGEKAEG